MSSAPSRGALDRTLPRGPPWPRSLCSLGLPPSRRGVHLGWASEIISVHQRSGNSRDLQLRPHAVPSTRDQACRGWREESSQTVPGCLS